MPQNEHIERHRKLFGRKFDHYFRQQKKQLDNGRKQVK